MTPLIWRVFLVVAALCLTVFQGCGPISQVQVEGEQVCGPDGKCPDGLDCINDVCVEVCPSGACDAGGQSDASCIPGECSDDAGTLVPDTGCAGSCDDAHVAGRTCDDDPCFAGVSCTPVDVGAERFVCGACPEGYQGDGQNCSDIDGCAGSPCFSGVTCSDVAADQVATVGAQFTCGSCPSGYSGNGVTCSDIDGCSGAPCYPGVNCTDVAAGDVPTLGAEFTCGSCPSGYSGNGITCADINECASNPCDSGQTCTNTAGSYDCEDPADCTLWDNSANAPCASGYYNCDCAGHCGATSPCGPVTTGGWPPTDADEIANYHGRYNGDRPTWYFSQRMSAYPSSFTVIVHGCGTLNVTGNNGTRWEGNGYIVKQSDVAGRGMAVVAPSSCQSDKCYLRY